MPVKLNSTGGGSVTVTAVNTASDYTLTAPAKTGNIITSADSGTVTAAMLASGAARSNFGAGAVLQVVTATTTSSTASSSTSFVAATNVTASITPASASNKIFVIVNACILNAAGVAAYTTIYRNGSNLFGTSGLATSYSASGGQTWFPFCISCLDSPSSTSSVTYALYFRPNSASSTTIVDSNGTATITLMEIAG